MHGITTMTALMARCLRVLLCAWLPPPSCPARPEGACAGHPRLPWESQPARRGCPGLGAARRPGHDESVGLYSRHSLDNRCIDQPIAAMKNPPPHSGRAELTV